MVSSNLCLVGLLTGAVASAGSAAPHSPRPAATHFGEHRQWALEGASNVGLFGVHQRGTLGQSSSTLDFGLNPGAMFFVASRLAVGGRLQAGVLKGSGTSSTLVGLGPSIGYLWPVAQNISFLPTLSLSYTWQRQQTQTFGARFTGEVTHALDVAVDAAIVYQLAEHLAVRAGPQLVQNIACSDDLPSTTRYGLRLGLIGWL